MMFSSGKKPRLMILFFFKQNKTSKQKWNWKLLTWTRRNLLKYFGNWNCQHNTRIKNAYIEAKERNVQSSLNWLFLLLFRKNVYLCLQTAWFLATKTQNSIVVPGRSSERQPVRRKPLLRSALLHAPQGSRSHCTPSSGRHVPVACGRVAWDCFLAAST